MDSKKTVLYVLNILLLFLFIVSCNADTDSDKLENVYTDANYSDYKFNKINNDITNSRQNAITKVVSECSEAIVGINVTEVIEKRALDIDIFEYFFGGNSTRRYEVKGLGSGFIISPDGYILTNHHVAGNASKIVVTLTNGEKYDADIIGSDMVSDVCLLKINSENKKLPYLRFSNSNNVIVGEWAIAFGNPFGLFDMNAKPSVTVGVISNKGVNFFQNDKYTGEYRVYKDMLQTDAAISSGNSGGPLLNALGEVIGMNTVIFSTATSNKGAGSIGIGFSVPINRVRNIVDILKSGRKIERNIYIGMEIDIITPEIARYYKLPKNEGIYVNRIFRNSIADDAGIEPGDVIVKINGEDIINSDMFYIAIGDAMVGDKLNLEILRGNQKSNHTLKIKSQK